MALAEGAKSVEAGKGVEATAMQMDKGKNLEGEWIVAAFLAAGLRLAKVPSTKQCPTFLRDFP